jgi:hypothetical protein
MFIVHITKICRHKVRKNSGYRIFFALRLIFLFSIELKKFNPYLGDSDKQSLLLRQQRSGGLHFSGQHFAGLLWFTS